MSPLLSPLSLRRCAAHSSRSPASTVEKKVTTRSTAQNGKQKRREALLLSSSKKRKKLGEVVYFVFSLPLLFLSYLVLSCFVCGRVSEYWPLCGKLTRLIVVIIFDILMFYLQINSSYSYPVILSCLDLVRTHPSIVVTQSNPACEF